MENINRTEKRKLATRNQIVESAIMMLQKMSSAELKLEQVADQADVSRKTIYNHFSSKEHLISEIINPILEFCISSVETSIKEENITIQTISNLCLRIYSEYGEKLNLMYNINFTNLESSFILHKKYAQLFIILFEKVDDLKCENIEPRKTAFLIFQMFVPILKAIDKVDNYEILFNHALTGFLKGLE